MSIIRIPTDRHANYVSPTLAEREQLRAAIIADSGSVKAFAEKFKAAGSYTSLTQELGMGTYKGFELLEEMPNGWVLDKTAGSPLFGYAFVSNQRSILNGGKRALLRVVKPQMQICYEEQKQKIIEQTEKQPEQIIDCGYMRTVNELARAKFKKQILNEILVDLMICEIEGWCKKDYINELKELICSLGNQQCIDA